MTTGVLPEGSEYEETMVDEARMERLGLSRSCSLELRTNYITYIWKHSIRADVADFGPDGYGWSVKTGDNNNNNNTTFI